MKFEDLFPDLETCKKFDKEDFKDSNFIWYSNGLTEKAIIRRLRDKPMYDEVILAPAPTTDELLAELPMVLAFSEEDLSPHFNFFRLSNNDYFAGYYSLPVAKHFYDCEANASVQALAELYLKLKSEKIL